MCIYKGFEVVNRSLIKFSVYSPNKMGDKKTDKIKGLIDRIPEEIWDLSGVKKYIDEINPPLISLRFRPEYTGATAKFAQAEAIFFRCSGVTEVCCNKHCENESDSYKDTCDKIKKAVEKYNRKYNN
jgi:hypothetical protein